MINTEHCIPNSLCMRPVRLVYIDLVCIINCFRVANLISLTSLVCLFNSLQYKQADFTQKLQLKIIQRPGIVLIMQIISFDCSWSSRLCLCRRRHLS